MSKIYVGKSRPHQKVCGENSDEPSYFGLFASQVTCRGTPPMRFSCRLSPSTGLSLTFVAFLSTMIALTVKSRSLVRLCLILIILLSDIIYGAPLLPSLSLVVVFVPLATWSSSSRDSLLVGSARRSPSARCLVALVSARYCPGNNRFRR